jgi:type I restriction enzyme M protein
MAYWTDTMQDDVYMITEEGWVGANKLRLLKGDSKESADLKVDKLKYKADLIPPDLIIARYFSDEQAEIEALEAEKDAIVQEREAMEEEHGGEGGMLEDSKSDAGNVTKGAAQARYREIGDDPEYADELAVLKPYLDLRDQETKAGRKIRKAQKALDKQVYEKYGDLSEAEIKSLVVDDKWLATLEAAVQDELDQVSRTLTGRVQELAERYGTSLPEIAAKVDGLGEKVEAHLERMGYEWK